MWGPVPRGMGAGGPAPDVAEVTAEQDALEWGPFVCAHARAWKRRVFRRGDRPCWTLWTLWGQQLWGTVG